MTTVSYDYVEPLSYIWIFFNAVNWRNESGIIPGYESSDLVKINDYWMKVCKNLDYGHIKNSRHEQFKDTQICTNCRKWRKCHFHLPTENLMLNIWLHNISSLCYFHPPPLNTPWKNMICDNTLIRLNINIYVKKYKNKQIFETWSQESVFKTFPFL